MRLMIHWPWALMTIGISAAAASTHAADDSGIRFGLSDIEIEPVPRSNELYPVPVGLDGRPGFVSVTLNPVSAYFYEIESDLSVRDLGVFAMDGGGGSLCAVGDLNGDSLADVAVIPDQAKQIYVFFQEASSLFRPSVREPLPAGTSPQELTVGDVDGDGWNDIITVASGARLVYRGLGDERFAFPEFAGDVSASSERLVAAGNLDQLPGEELVVSAADGFRILRRDNNGYTEWQAIQAYSIPQDLFVGDVDGDKDLDVICAGVRLANHWAQFFEQVSPGNFFAHPRQLTPASSADRALFGDFNSDGRVDLASSLSGTLHIYYGSDSQASRFESAYPLYQRSAPFDSGDYDGDGVIDFAFSSPLGIQVLRGGDDRFQDRIAQFALPSGVSPILPTLFPDPVGNGRVVYAQDGGRPFMRRIFIEKGAGATHFSTDFDPTLRATSDMFFGFPDLNGDGLADWLRIGRDLPNPQNFAVGTRWGAGQGLFGTLLATPGPYGADRGWGVGDFNGDGYTDLVYNNQNISSLQGHAGTLIQGFELPQEIPTSDRSTALGVGDFDRDGYHDVVRLRVNGRLEVLFGSSAWFTEAVEIVLPQSGSSPTRNGIIAVEDMNGDGLPDICVPLTTGLAVIRSEGSRGFAQPDFVGPEVRQVEYLRVKDMDGDRRPEIFVTTRFDGLWIFALDGDVRYTRASRIRFAESGVEIGDFDDNGVDDIVSIVSGFVTVFYADSSTRCLADFDFNDRVDWFDLVVFLNQFRDGVLWADLNDDGELNFFDVVEFLDRFQLGCE